MDNSDNKNTIKTAFSERFPVIDAAGGIVVNEKNELLLIFRRGFWDLPKGKKETGECFEECALREVEEETGIKNLKIVKKIDDTQHFMLEHGEKYIKNTVWYLMTTNFSGKLIPQIEEDIEIAAWFDKSKIIALKPMYANIQEILEKCRI
ncbi:MAG: NUDIX domain-containing protein [Bacteroidales bacterium]|jgi:8-oxo-dGTP pyrophosphatase MutT (NUDIX family)|nr:NUDIX domain-containing protein [Bacteroidales bacterium]